MIDEWNGQRTGFARFSDDRTKRYRLGRALTPIGLLGLNTKTLDVTAPARPSRIVFVMLNPSTADAFKLDPTVNRCSKFAQLWGGAVLEVVNLFAYRSPYPEDLYVLAKQAADMGADAANDDEIRAACDGATRVIAAWGRHGRLNDRALHVAELLARDGVKLEALGTTDEGFPLHPLARGKHFIPYDREPQPWA